MRSPIADRAGTEKTIASRIRAVPLLAALLITVMAWITIAWISTAWAQDQGVQECLVKTQQFDRDARAICDQVLKEGNLNDEDRAQALLGRGMAATFAKDYVPAVDDLSEAIKLKQDFATAYLMRGVAYRDLGKDDLAIADFSKTIELRPTLSAGYSDRADLLIKRKDWLGALSDLEQVVTLVPKDPGAMFLRGYAHEKLHHPEEAAHDYSAARALDPHIDDEMRNDGFVPGG